MSVENIEAYYEDIESLNKLDVTHTFRCQKQELRFTKSIQNIQLVAPTSSKIK